MRRTHLPIFFQELLQRIPYVTIATVCADGRPWNTPVVGRFDDQLNLYWVSWKGSQHSQNIARNPDIFVVVYDSSVPEGEGTGLYMQMEAKPLQTLRDVAAAGRWYDLSFFTVGTTMPSFVDKCPSRIYKATPQRLWHNIDIRIEGHFVDARQELMLEP